MPHALPKRPQRSFSIAHQKPSTCSGCVLEARGKGYVPADGPVGAPILLVGEAAGYDEIATGRPFVGAAGSMLTKILRMNGYLREDFRIDNTVRCAPPELALEGTSYAASAISHCSPYLDQTLSEGPKVVVPLGSVALRRVLGLAKVKGVRVQDFHGTVSRDPSDRFWVVPTFHPSHLQRGATNLLGTVSFDLQRAHEIARGGREPDPASVVCDPPLEWFRHWSQAFIAALASDPDGIWLSVDIETPDKGADEGELLATGADASYRILRVNLSCHPDEGITVPFEGEYIAALADLFQQVDALGGTLLMWFRGFDLPRLLAAGMKLTPSRVWDLMWMAKVLHSDLPMGLGFWAPFYSAYGAWKHLSSTQPAKYAAIDGFQTLRVGHGIVSDLIDAGQWEVFNRHLHEFHTYVLQPASDIGVPIDRVRLDEFKKKLDAHAHRLLYAVQQHVPEDLRPLTPKEGLTRAPAPGELHTKGRATKKDGVTPKKEAPDPIKAAFYAQAKVVRKLVIRVVNICQRCGANQVTRKHRCEDGDPDEARVVIPQPMTVTRWFWQEPFNADSPKQLLEYAKLKKHEPGRNKKSGGDSMDRETLERLAKTGDPLYQMLLDYRAVAKVRGTYAIGTEKRLDGDDRLHPTFTFKPSTMRLSCVSPNIQNVITDRGGSESLAAGFRRCVTGRDGVPSWVTAEAMAAWQQRY
jgi:uracil-DNA glycosylase family 4